MSRDLTVIPNEMVRASAGSGKTYQLVNRYISLLLCGQASDRIIALTFTRKAAGEFFEGILTKLANAASSQEAARHLSANIGMPAVSQADYTRVLRELLERMPHLALGTIDGFFHRVLGMFSLEYGLSGEFEIMDEFSAERARVRSMEQLFASASARDQKREAMVKSFELLSAGKQDRRFYNLLENYLRECHGLYRRALKEEKWGNPATIWPTGLGWAGVKDGKSQLVQNFSDALRDQTEFDNRSQKAWRKAAEHLERWEAGKDLLAGGGTLLITAFAQLAQLDSGAWTFVYYRNEFKPTATFSKTLAELLKHCLAQELDLHLTRTRGVFGMLKEYDACYDTLIRRQGLLTFADLPILLAPEEGRPVLGGHGPDRLSLEYRLDGAFDHWLIDEFQDTSTAQWRVMENLIDEVIQDPEHRRTFFCVGDVKQSIYGWRGGDPKLFNRVKDRYCREAGNELNITPMNVSYRSAPPVLELVNKVFGSHEELAEFDAEALNRWSDLWEDHVAAAAHRDMAGHTMHLTVTEKTERYPVLAQLLADINPVERGLSCVVLVQTNAAVREVVDYLRKNVQGLPVTGESATRPATDNAAGRALLSLLKAAAHPMDTYAAEHVRMTPLAKKLPDDHPGWANTMRAIQEQLYHQGFERTVREWAGELATDDFARWRVRQFIEMARQFDETGLRDIDEFIWYAQQRELNEGTGSKVVQVMTVHKAKGLTFDVVLVPDLEGERLDARRRSALYAQEDEAGEVEWVLELPKQDLCAADRVLRRAVVEGRSEACFENFCRLYVALTRSKHALYIISTSPKEKDPPLNYVRLLNQTLGATEETWAKNEVKAVKAYESGRADWLCQLELKSKPTPMPKPKVRVKGARSFPRLERRKPSEHGGLLICGGDLFATNSTLATQFGSEVHKAFEWIEWWNDEAQTQLEKQRSKISKAVEAVERCFGNAAITAHFTADPSAKVWRERAFEVMIDGELCSGVFDRVVMRTDCAEIVDFKTDRVQDEAELTLVVERHRPQLDWYRRVLMQMNGLAADQITCRLLFTHIQRLVDV